MNDEKNIGDAEKMVMCVDEENARRRRNSNLTIMSSCPFDPSIEQRGQKPEASSFQELRVLCRLQAPLTAARLVRLAGGTKKAIETGSPDRYERARWLEEAVAQLAQARPADGDAQALQRCLTRLLRQSFGSLDWRRPLIAGLKPARTRI